MREMTKNEERYIREYVNSQSPAGDQVTLVQKIGTRKVLGRVHDLYDVRTERGRWWVITDLTNLYSQDDFMVIDMALTYHLGLDAMLAERGRKERGEKLPRRLTGAWRRFERAVDAYNDADEAEAFQGVGVMCREALLAFVRDEANHVTLAAAERRPKTGSFKEWVPILVRGLASHEKVREAVNPLGTHAWDYVVWLQHYTDAEPLHAEIALDLTAEFIGVYGRLVPRDDDQPTKRCPACASYRLEDASFLSDDKEWIVVTACAACGWESDRATAT